MMMLRLNWSQIRGLRDHLARQGFGNESELMIMTLYKNTEPIKSKVKFDQLEQYLFDVDSNTGLIGVYIFDLKSNKPLWSAKAAERQECLESMPTSGHPSIVSEFKNMSPEQKQVWIDITSAAITSYLNNEIQ